MSTTFKTIKIYTRENLRFKKLFFAVVFGWTAGIAAQKLLLPLIIARTIDKLINFHDIGAISWGMFSTELIIFVLLALGAQASLDTSLILLSKLEVKVMPELYNRIFHHLIHQSARFHANSFTGSLVTQTNRFVNAYQALTDSFVLNVSQIFILTLLSSFVLALYSPALAAVIISWSILFIFINYKLTKRRIKFAKAVAKTDTALTGYLADSLGNVSAIKSFATEKRESKQLDIRAQSRSQKKYAYWVQAVKNDAVFGILMSILQIAILATSIFLLKNQTMTIGTFVLAQVYATQIMANLWGLSSIMRTIEQQLSDAAEMTEILEIPFEVNDLSETALKVRRGEIVFDNVTFKHAENDGVLFDNLNLKIKPGEKVGLVGTSGGGKTTLTKILLRFADITSGAITIDGQDIKDVSQASLREHIAYVPQEPLLFHRSLAENIAYGNIKASSEEVQAVARLAHAHDFVQSLPLGYDTPVGERGIKLSGGQRQRIAIARAMLKNAPILVLDEATSALDSESEQLIQDALWKLMEGRTAIVIAHRLSTIQKMDRIIVMDHGKIVEEGTHKELVRKNGQYANLWSRQSGGFLDEE